MERRAMLSLTGCFFVGCASAQSFQVQANPDVNPFSCVTKELAQRDFTVTTAERDAGLLIAEKRDSQSASVLTGEDYYQVLTFNILDDGTIRAHAKREVRKGGGSQIIGIKGAGDAAQGILQACGTGAAEQPLE